MNFNFLGRLRVTTLKKNIMMKVLGITGSRADYDLMSGVFRLLSKDKNIDLKILVTGAHLSHIHGYTIEMIKNDSLDILISIESLISSDSNTGRIKTTSVFLQNSIDIINNFSPNIIIYAGDREEVVVGGLIGSYLEIPTIHFFGGDHVSDGHVDNSIRHATSKLSTIHFVTLEEHKKRLIKMGENKNRIFIIGNPSLDKFINEKHLSKKETLTKLNLNYFNDYALVIYHSSNRDGINSARDFKNILELIENNDLNAVVSYPNTDPGNNEINRIIEGYKSNKNFYFYKNLDRNIFVNLYRHASFQIGNSSSGILEASTIPIPVINVGTRQTGRKSNNNVLFTSGDKKEIQNALNKIKSQEFLNSIKLINNLYGDGNSSKKALDLIKTIDFKKLLLKREDPLNAESQK